MHSNSQSLNFNDSNISDEEFYDAEENDFSDLESIPNPSSFQICNLSSSASPNQSKFDYFGNTYQGNTKGGQLSGFGKLSSSDEKEYIEGMWENSQLIKVFSCQFIHLIRSMHSRNEMRIYGEDNLFTFNRGSFVAKIKFGELKELNFTRSLNPLNSRRGFLEKVTIIEVLKDTLLDQRNAALEKFLQSSISTENLLQFYDVLREYKGSNQGIAKLNKHILNKISNTGTSVELRNNAKQLLSIEQLLLERNKGFPKFNLSIQHNLPNLLNELTSIRREKIIHHKRLLLRKCPHYSHSAYLSSLMIQSIHKLPDPKILYLSDKDIQLFSDLTTFAEQSEHLEQLWQTLLSKVKGADSKSLKGIGPFTHPIYLHLFKSFQELITEISNVAEIPKENLLNIDSAGNWHLLEEGSMKKKPQEITGALK